MISQAASWITRSLPMKQAASIGISGRRLFAIAGLSAGATLLAQHPLFAAEEGIGPAMGTTAANAKFPTITPGTNTSFGALKQIEPGS